MTNFCKFTASFLLSKAPRKNDFLKDVKSQVELQAKMTTEVVLTSTHNVCFEQKYARIKNIRVFLSENFQFLEVKFSIYLNRRVFVINE